MLSCFYPDVDVKSTYQIDFEAFYRHGYRAVIFDIDNTLVPHGAPADEEAIRLFDELHAMGFSTMLLSNNRELRVKPFAKQVKSPYIFKAGKPGKDGYRQAMEQMGTSPETTLCVGDQLFTDIWGAKRLRIFTVLTAPINPKEEIQIVLKRILEKPVLYFYNRQKEHNYD